MSHWLSIWPALRLVVTITVGMGLLCGSASLPVLASIVGDSSGRAVSATVGDQALVPGGPPGVLQDTNWWASVQDGIRRSEYEVTWQDQTDLAGTGLNESAAAYQAPNRAHSLRTFL